MASISGELHTKVKLRENAAIVMVRYRTLEPISTLLGAGGCRCKYYSHDCICYAECFGHYVS